MWESYGVRDKRGRSRKEKEKKEKGKSSKTLSGPGEVTNSNSIRNNARLGKVSRTLVLFFFLLLLRQKLGNMKCAARSDEGSDGHAHHCTSGETGGRESEREREREGM